MKRDYFVSLSGGKDSSAMLIHLIEEDYPIDKIVFADTGLELPELYDYLDTLEEYTGKKICRLTSDKSFEDYFYEIPAYGKYHDLQQIRGFPPVFAGCYICRDLKLKQLHDYAGQNPVTWYVGIAIDERHRARAKAYTNSVHDYEFPLISWGWTEKDCVTYLRERGLQHPLEKLRSGCYLCPKQPIASLEHLYNSHPVLWQKLKRYELQAPVQFHPDYTITELELRFRGWNDYQTQLTLFKNTEVVK